MAIATPHSTTLYTLGRGIVEIAEWSGGSPGDYEDVGNCSKFEVEVVEENLPHYSSRSGTKNKDKSAVLEIGYNLAFDLEEVSIGNLAKLLKATISGAGSHVLLAMTQLDKEYAVKFTSDNPYGPNEVWEFWKCTLDASGPFSLIGEDWAKLSFAAEGLGDSDNHATSPYYTVTFVTTTSTTTSTSTTISV